MLSVKKKLDVLAPGMSANVEKLKKLPNNVLARLYHKLYAYYKGDPGKLTLFTMVVLLASEAPIWFFTLLDVLKLKSLFKYRLHYDPSETRHLGVRNYPPNDLVLRTALGAEKNFIGAYLIPGTLGIALANKLGIFVYDTDEKDVTWWRILKEAFMISVAADFLFYALHRLVHTKHFYLSWHKKHHEFKYSIAFAHHWMTFKEALVFALPQAVPPMLLGLLTGQKTHILSMWLGFSFTQLNAIVGHAGYQIPFIPRWFPLMQASYHDWHHIDYSSNFGAIYPIVDWMFGTYLKAKVVRDFKQA